MDGIGDGVVIVMAGNSMADSVCEEGSGQLWSGRGVAECQGIGRHHSGLGAGDGSEIGGHSLQEGYCGIQAAGGRARGCYSHIARRGIWHSPHTLP